MYTYRLSNSVFDGPITNLILIETLSHAHGRVGGGGGGGTLRISNPVTCSWKGGGDLKDFKSCHMLMEGVGGP